MNSYFSQHSSQCDYLDMSWETMDYKEREKISLEQAKQTALFAKRHVPFYQQHYSRIQEEEIMKISSIEEFSTFLPITTKAHLISSSFKAFLPERTFEEEVENEEEFSFRNHGTGGTTGKPVTVIHSAQDWRAMAKHIARSIKFDFRDRLGELKGKKILGLYHGDHVTNRIYASGLRLLGVDMFHRVSTKMDLQSNYDFLQDICPNGLLAPPEDPNNTQTKGILLDSIFKIDARSLGEKYRLNYSKNKNFSMIFWSSLPISEDLQNYIINHLKVPYQQAQYGSTEICPTGATCSEYPRDFHLGYGPTLLAVRSFSGGGLCKEGERGYVVVTKTGSTRFDGKNIVPTGTVLINYLTGDSACLIHQNGKVCACGRNTPVLFGIKRVDDVEVKMIYGCQTD